jgi:uncharacterized protein (DUF1697 family)
MSMPRFAVLLRGVNVGKGKRVPMAEFRRLLEGLGYTGVRTLLNSGNAVFTSPGRSAAAHAGKISTSLRDGLGVTTQVVVKSRDDFGAVARGNPIMPPEDHHSRLLVAFAQEPGALGELAAVAALVRPPERYAVSRDAAYLHCADGILASKAASALLGKAGQGVTTRNWATVLKLEALLQDDPA